MKNKNTNSAQAALEYLITYGWALVVIATIIGVLVFTASGGVNQDTCTTFLHLICKGVSADADKLVLILQNATGQKITINPFTDICFDGKCGYGKIIYQGNEYRFQDITIGPGETFTIEATGQALANQIDLTYIEGSTGFTRNYTSTISTSAPNNIEISNDGIDNDGDGSVDCADPGVAVAGACEYPVEVTSVGNGTTPTMIEISSPEINKLIATGSWNIKTAYLYFYVTTTPELSTKAIIGDGKSTKDINQGWNSIEIKDADGNPVVMLTDPPKFELASDGAAFSIAGVGSATPPKMVITLEESATLPP